MDLRIEQLPKIRVTPHARRGLSALAARAPQAEAFGERLGQRLKDALRSASTWLYNSRRRLATLAVLAIAVWLFFHVTFGANGMLVYRQKRAENHRKRGPRTAPLRPPRRAHNRGSRSSHRSNPLHQRRPEVENRTAAVRTSAAVHDPVEARTEYERMSHRGANSGSVLTSPLVSFALFAESFANFAVKDF